MRHKSRKGSAPKTNKFGAPKKKRGKAAKYTPEEKKAIAVRRQKKDDEKKREHVEKKRAQEEEQQAREATWEKEREPIEPALYEEGEEHPFRCGYAALVGRPNVGKSTLLNALLGQKLAATTHKPQTTRKNLLGVLNPQGGQLMFLDTPGHHQAKGPLNRYMVAQAEEAMRDADVLVWLVEARADEAITPGNQRILKVVQKTHKPVILLINKVDSLKNKEGMLHQIASYQEQLGEQLQDVVPISARKGLGLVAAVKTVAKALPEGPALFPVDEVTDRSEREIVAEFIREKAMLETKDELPYSVAVTIDSFEDYRPRLVRVLATLHVERDSQKAIMIGKGGHRLKSLGTRARKDIEFLLASKVYLELAVRVTGGWSSDQKRMLDLGYGQEQLAAVKLSDEEMVLDPEMLAAAAELTEEEMGLGDE